MSTVSPNDSTYLATALKLARRGLGEVEPNPMVGAVIVRSGKIVGEGWHQRFGGPHAEIMALAAAGKKARGATLYVTLEPCCHFGKTPPCTEAILRAGIRRVVAAMVDPFALVQGRGIRRLRRAGVTVEVGLLENEAKELNASFIKRVSTGRPWVIAKWGQTLDGCIATAAGQSRWITSPAARAEVQQLRARVDAIIIGINTALTDDPLLLARPANRAHFHRIPARIILDSQCRLPLASQLVRTISFAPVILLHAARLSPQAKSRRHRLMQRGVVAVPIKSTPRGLAVPPILDYLGSLQFANVLLEGGSEIFASFLAANQIDQAIIYVSGKIFGGGAKHAIGGPILKNLHAAPQLKISAVQMIGPDIKITAQKN